MLLEVCTLRKALGTSRYSASEGLLLCVYPEVIEEVASLSELFSAILVAALHDSPDALRARVLIAENLIVRSIRNMLGLADPMEGLHFLLSIFFSDDLPIFPGGLVVRFVLLLVEEGARHLDGG